MSLFEVIIKEVKLFAKYGTVGFVGTVIDFGSLYLMVEYLKLPLYPAITIAFLLAVINNYTFNKIWTFKNRSKAYGKQFAKFFVVSIGGLILTNTSMYIQVEIMGLWYMLAKFTTAFIVPIWNYVGNKCWTFRGYGSTHEQ